VLCCAFVVACSAPSSDAPAPGETSARRAPVAKTPADPAAPAAPAAPPTAVAAAKPETGRLAAPATMRNWNDVRRQAALRLVAANPAITYMGKVPDQLLAIPVLEVELNRDGSVRRIVTLREPRQAKDTLRIATDAIHRAAPFGDVSHLPRPWKFVETFLFDDDRKFKPRVLDE
jgi:hypothetical protein